MGGLKRIKGDRQAWTRRQATSRRAANPESATFHPDWNPTSAVSQHGPLAQTWRSGRARRWAINDLQQWRDRWETAGVATIPLANRSGRRG
jgi:hypothetical protein